MDFTQLRSFNKVFPLYVEKYELFGVDENSSITAKINSIVQVLNRVGKLSNDVIKDWNKVMDWAMGEGLNESVDKKVEELIANGRFDALLQPMFDEINVRVDGFETQLAQIASLNDFPRLSLEVSDSPRIQRAIDFVKTTTTGAVIEAVAGAVNSKRTILLPAGRLIVSQTIKLPSYIQFVGSGRHTTILESTITDGSPVLLVDGNDATSTHAFYNTIKGFSIDGKALNCQGIKFNFAHRWTLEDVFIGSTKKEALYLWESYIGDIQSCYVFGCGDVGVPAVKLDGRDADHGNHAVNFYGGEIVGSPDYGIYIHYGAAISIFGTTVEGNNKAGIAIDTTLSTTIIGSYLELNKNHIEIINATSPTITGNYLANLKVGSLGGIGIGKLYGGEISNNTLSETLTAGQYDFFAIGADVDLRFRSSIVKNNFSSVLPNAIQANLLSLAKTSGTTIETDNMVNKQINGAPNYLDGILTNGLNVLGGSSDPVSTITAPQGSIYLRSGGNVSSSLYGKIGAGTTGWRAVQLINQGSTANRPTGTIPAGFNYFDQTLNKPIWWHGSAWIDATGTAV